MQPQQDKIWILDLQEDPTSGDLFIDLPQELLYSQGWAPGDILIWQLDEESRELVLKKAVT